MDTHRNISVNVHKPTTVMENGIMKNGKIDDPKKPEVIENNQPAKDQRTTIN